MKRFLPFLLMLLWALGARAASPTIITATITVTNTAGTTNGQTLTVNGNTRTWTNSVVVPTSQILTNNNIGGCATNMFAAIADAPFAGLSLAQLTNGMTLQTIMPNGALSASVSAGWAAVVLTTNTLTSAQVVRVPLTVEYSTNQTNIATYLAQGLESSTYGISATAPVVSNLVNLTQAQTVTGQKTFISPIGTNGYFNLSFFNSPIFTNAINYGNALSSRGTNSLSEQFGAGAVASSNSASAFGSQTWAAGQNSTAVGSGADAVADYSSALGSSALASGTRAIALGVAARAQGNSSVAIGNQSTAVGVSSVALGDSANTANANNATAVGQGSAANWANSTAVGQGVSTTTSNQVMLGQSGQTVAIPGNVAIGGVGQNVTLTGTNTLQTGADLAFNRFALTTLANGNNAAVAVGTNVFVEVSGPTGAFSINGIAGGRDGKFLIILNRTGQQMTLAHDSGVDPTSANRLYSNSGADQSVAGNSAALLIYSGQASHWIVLSFNNGTFGAYTAGYSISFAGSQINWNAPAQITNHVAGANVDGFVANATSATSASTLSPGATGTGLTLSSLLVANGVDSTVSNKLAPVSITPGSSPYNYTNALSYNIFVWVQSGTVSSIAINGSSVFSSTGQIIPLQPGEWTTVTYSGAPPGMFYKPF